MYKPSLDTKGMFSFLQNEVEVSQVDSESIVSFLAYFAVDWQMQNY
jgi:hypothetical protein